MICFAFTSIKKSIKITIVNDYEDGVYYSSVNKIKNGLSLRGISIHTTKSVSYPDRMVWDGDLKSSDILMLLHSQKSNTSGKIQSIVQCARDDKKPLIIVYLDDTPLTGDWELILTDYNQYQTVKYNNDNPNDSILEIEKIIKDIERVSLKPSMILYYISICAGFIAIGVAIFLALLDIDSIDLVLRCSGFVALLFVVCCYAVKGILRRIKNIAGDISEINDKNSNISQNKVFTIKDKKKPQSISTDKKMIEYKCFVAGATTITKERDAVRASFSQVANRWAALNFRLSAYTFEDFDNNHQQQIRYDEFIQNEADCVIVIIADGIGPKTIGEYRLAVSTLQKTKKRPKVVVYADEKSKNDPNVVEFKKEVEKNKTYWVSYTSLNELKEKIQNEMTKQLLPIVQETIKKS